MLSVPILATSIYDHKVMIKVRILLFFNPNSYQIRSLFFPNNKTEKILLF